MAKKKEKSGSLGVFFLNEEKRKKLILPTVVLSACLFALVFVETGIAFVNIQNFLEIRSLASLSVIEKGKSGLGEMTVIETKTVGTGQPYRNWRKDGFPVNSKAVLVYDLTTGKVLLDYNAKEVLPMASVTKLMSMVVIEDNRAIFGDNEWLQFTLEDIEIEGKKNIFAIGEEYGIDSLIAAALISSSNEATSLLARSVSSATGNDFVKMMQEKARVIGLEETRFSNPIGFDGDHFSTTRDIAALLEWILGNRPELLEKSTLLQTTIRSRTEKEVLIRNTNYMILGEFHGIVGSKTGYTDLAQGCMALVKKIENDLVVFVILGSENRTTEMRSLINWTESAYGF